MAHNGRTAGVTSPVVLLLWTLVTLAVVSEMTLVAVNARYLPTRGQDDRIERLRELLKDLLGNQYDYTIGEGAGVEPGAAFTSAGRGIPQQHTVMFKREIPASHLETVNNSP